MAKKIIEGLWDCQYCSTKGIKGRFRVCPGCGKPRGDGIKFYLPKDYKNAEAVNLRDEEKLPDWQCAYCGSLNKAVDVKCSRCGAPKEGKSYFELHKDVKESSYSASHVNTNWKCAYCGTENPKDSLVCSNCGSGRSSSKEENEKAKKAKAEGEKEKKGVSWLLIAALGAAAVIIFLFYNTFFKESSYKVLGFSWETTTEIEEYKTVEESGWNMPDGARLKYTREVEYSFRDSMEDEAVEAASAGDSRYRSSEDEKSNITAYISSHDPFVLKVFADDLGNGYFEVDDGGGDWGGGDDWDDDDTVEYRTKYYYEIDRWVVTRKLKTSGDNQSPYDPEVDLRSGEREGNTYTRYYVYASREDRDAEYYEVSESAFYGLEMGMEFEASGAFNSLSVKGIDQ